MISLARPPALLYNMEVAATFAALRTIDVAMFIAPSMPPPYDALRTR